MTSSSAAPAEGAGPSSCGRTSRRTSSPDAHVFVADRFRASAAPDTTPDVPRPRGGRLPGRPQPRARRLRPVGPARRSGSLPPGQIDATLADAPLGSDLSAAHRSRRRWRHPGGPRPPVRPVGRRRLRDRRRSHRFGAPCSTSRRSERDRGITAPSSQSMLPPSPGASASRAGPGCDTACRVRRAQSRSRRRRPPTPST